MQVFKKFFILSVVALLVGCGANNTQKSFFVREVAMPSEIDTSVLSQNSFRVGVLLPLTGGSAKYGQGLQNAAIMAFEDMNNPDLILQFYDTNSTPQGAKEAAKLAIKQDVELIIGPLSAQNVQAISSQTKRANVPVITFSTNSDVLEYEVYGIGLLVDEQVTRIMSYAGQKNLQKIALLVPDNKVGLITIKSAIKQSIIDGTQIVRIAYYNPDDSDFSAIVAMLTDYQQRSEPIKKEKELLLELSKLGDEEAISKLKNLQTKETAFGVDFDAVLIPETGAKLKSMSSMLGYYDVFASDTKFLGTSVWENTKLNSENNITNGWYPALSRNHKIYFNKKYHYLFDEYPNSLYTFSYDAVALASVLAKKQAEDINSAITNPDGFIGISGVFRFFNNGRSEHSLDIIEITRAGDVVKNLAPKKFYNTPSADQHADIADFYDMHPPLIFGKDAYVAEVEIFGRNLSDDNRVENFYSQEVIDEFFATPELPEEGNLADDNLIVEEQTFLLEN